MEKIVNKTVIDFKTFRDYYFLNLRRNKMVVFISIFGMIALIMILIALAYNIINYFLNGEPLSIKTFTPAIILGSIIIVYYSFVYTFLLNNYRKNKESFSKPISYTFDEEKIIVSVGGTTRERTILSYSDIIGVFENKKYFVVALKNKRSTLIRKDAFKKEESEIISSRFKEIMTKLTDEALNIK